ncbi:MAG: hypothetical protein MUE61_18020, partial [Vicinamibacterales bacterium]|nr:hypothetical protein [Vicinamibacterales bacterium]
EGGLSLVLPRSGRIVAKYHASNEVFERESFDTSGLQFLAGSQLTKELRLQGTFVLYQPSEQWLFDLRGTYQGFSRTSDGRRLYDYGIYRAKTTYQWNRYLFFRGIAEYNSYRRQLLTDVLASFTYIPASRCSGRTTGPPRGAICSRRGAGSS